MVDMTPLEKANQLMHYGALAFADMEENGIRVDVERLLNEKAKLNKSIRAKEAKFSDTKIYHAWKKEYKSKTNIGSKTQLGDVLFRVLKYKCVEYTTTHKPKTDADALLKLNLPELKDYLSVEKDKKTLSFLDGIYKEVCDEFLHPSFNLHLVRTYRSSSDSPNFQNFPVRDMDAGRAIRSCFIARDDHQLVEIDFSGVEVRVAACYNKDPTLISYICDKSKDMHRDMAAQCYKLKPEEVDKKARYCGKNMFVFPQFYGSYFMQCAPHLWNAVTEMGLKTPAGISLHDHLARFGIKTLGIPGGRDEVEPGTFIAHIQKVEKDFWERRFKVYAEWKKSWYRKYLKKGYFDLKTGFRCSGHMYRNDVINYPVQGAAFHCLLWCVIKLNHWLKKNQMKSKIVGQIHDSIVADVHKDEVKEYITRAVEIMSKEILEYWKWIIVPLEVEVEVADLGSTWFDKKGYEI